MKQIVHARMQCLLVFLFLTVSSLNVDASIGAMTEDSISTTFSEITDLLEKGKADDGSILFGTYVDDMSQKMGQFSDKMKNFESLIEQLSEKESVIKPILQMANIRQMDSLIERLEKTLNLETALRELEDEEHRKQGGNREKNRRKKSPSYDTTEITDNIEITSTNLAERLDTHVIMEESEEEMKKWILTLIEDELRLYKKEIFNMASKIDTSNEFNNSDSRNTKATDCPSLTKIVQRVQQALNDHAEDGIGKVDHAQGASVVHWMTSETHSPSAGSSGTLGSVWWNKFIPQDWERLLPSGWEKWDAWIPSYIYNSLGFLSGDIAPPEAVLQKNTLPGSCWPMEGSSGQIALKLPYPVVIESVSIDHISSDIIPKGKFNSAPRHLKVIGYSPCEEKESSCGAIGFDLTDPIDIAEINYDVEGSSVQTFQSNYAKAMASIPTPSFDTDGTGSCSVQASCSTPPAISVSLVEVRILGNWGNPDFTCLYRLRVHGEPEKI